MKILVTGARGFAGSALINRLLSDRYQLIATVLEEERGAFLPAGVEVAFVKPLSDSSDYSAALRDVDVVIHLAARVHVMRETACDPLKEYRTVNTEGTVQLARQAAAAGVRRFVFMSTIGVNGNESNDKPFTEDDPPAPHSPYAVSKCEAEKSLAMISAESGMEFVILRSPIVYGPRNPGNFLSLLRWVAKSLPLPFASIDNKRSFTFVGNLADALTLCALQPQAAGQTYLVSDGEDVSTPELIYRVAAALGVRACLFPCPTGFLRLAGKTCGRSAAVDRLICSLQVDISKIRRDLGWTPPFTMEQGLRETAEWFKQQL